MTNRAPLTANELKAVAYFAVGVTSEGSIAGRDVSYRLGFAGNVGPGGRMQPVANSGYSFGTLQIDLGQHPDVARDLLDSYQAWARLQPDRVVLELGHDRYEEVLTALQRTGRKMREDNAVDIDRSGLDRFLSSDDGRSFVHGLDTAHTESITTCMPSSQPRFGDERLQRTMLSRMPPNEQARGGMFIPRRTCRQCPLAWAAGSIEEYAGVAGGGQDAIDGLFPTSQWSPGLPAGGRKHACAATAGQRCVGPCGHRCRWRGHVCRSLIGPVATTDELGDS